MNFLPFTISGYSLQRHNTVNIADLSKDTSVCIKHKNIEIPTGDIEIFDQYNISYIRELFDKQYQSLIKKIDLHLEYGMITKAEHKRSLNQYDSIFFISEDENNPSFVGFKKEELLKYKQLELNKSKVRKELNDSKPKPLPVKIPIKSHKLPKEEEVDYDDIEDELDGSPRLVKKLTQDQIGISVWALRRITGYSYEVKLAWHSTPVEVTWQKNMLEDNSNFLVVDGSRQGGKSFAISQKVLEESYIVGADMMVAAFQQDTTEVIWDYLLDLIDKLPEEDFTIKERKRYIQNNLTGTRIHFRTLQNWAKGIRGKTLRFIVVDEAMLISDDIFESILLPTQTTIENPKMILLGTASSNTSCFMYKLIRDIRKWEKYNNPDQYSARHIKFSILDNPFASPKMVQYAIDNKADPRVQREYFNKWGKIDEAMFQYPLISLLNVEPNTNYNLIITVDPARKWDRSAYAVLLAGNKKIILLESGEIPPHYKSTWSLQWKYLSKIRARYHKFPYITTAGDETGVGDGAFEVYETAAQFKIDKRIHYVQWISESHNRDKTVFHTGKSLLINTTLDSIVEKQLLVIQETNQMLIEEWESLEEFTNSLGHIAFKTTFFDDVTNAVMIWIYIAKKFDLHRKSLIEKEKPEDLWREEMKRYNQTGYQRKTKATRYA